MSMSPGLTLFYDLVHDLNSTLDLDNVLARVIDQVNQFLRIDATSVSLLDPETRELVIRMTIGQTIDPRHGLRLPPSAGIGGWVAHHGEAVLVSDVQQDPRFYPAVDQLTGFTTRSMLCVPLRIQERTIGVIQAISGRVEAFSRADLCFVEILADVAALAIENARLFSSEQRMRLHAEKFRLISETISVSLHPEIALDEALQYLHQVVACDSATVYVRREVPVFKPDSASGSGFRLHSEAYLAAVTAWGFDDPASVLELCVPVSDVPLFQQMDIYRRPIAIMDAQHDDRYVRLPGAKLVRSWMGVPMVVDGELIGQVALDRYHVEEFTRRDIDTAQMFAQQAAVALTNAWLYREAQDRADELSILNEIAMAVTASLEEDVLLGRAVDALLLLLGLSGAGIALLDESGGKLRLCVQRSLSSELLAAVACESIEAGGICHSVLAHGHTMLLASEAEDAERGRTYAGALVPLVTPDTPVGVLIVQGMELDRLSLRQLALLEAIGRQIGIAVDRARLYARTQKPVDRSRSASDP